MAASCTTYASGVSCRVSTFPSALPILKTNSKLFGANGVFARKMGCDKSLRAASLRHRLRSADIYENRDVKFNRMQRLRRIAQCPDLEKVVLCYTSQRRHGGLTRATLDADLSEQVSGQGKEVGPLHVALAGAALVALDKGTALCINRWEALPFRALPSSTVSMLLMVAALIAIDRADPSVSKNITQFFGPAVELIQRWMPLFYTPPLAMMSLIAQDIAAEEGLRLLTLVAGGWVVTLAAVGLLASLVKKGAQTRLGDAPNIPSTKPFNLWDIVTWAGAGAASGLVAYLAPNAFGFHQATVAAPFFICATIVGFLLGSQVPKPFKKFLHPVITSALFVNVIAFLAGAFTNRSFEKTLGMFLTKSMETPGGGDLLMALLGPLTLSYAFTLFRQRNMLGRHATELGTVVPLAGLFSLLITVIGGRQLGLHEGLTRSVAARSTTLAFAIPITTCIGGDESIAASAAIITGLLGANLSLRVLSALKIKDGMARALATACSSHGFGSAAVASGEADLLPFCAVTYILMGAVCSLAVSVPVIRSSVLQL